MANGCVVLNVCPDFFNRGGHRGYPRRTAENYRNGFPLLRSAGIPRRSLRFGFLGARRNIKKKLRLTDNLPDGRQAINGITVSSSRLTPIR